MTSSWRKKITLLIPERILKLRMQISVNTTVPLRPSAAALALSWSSSMVLQWPLATPLAIPLEWLSTGMVASTLDTMGFMGAVTAHCMKNISYTVAITNTTPITVNRKLEDEKMMGLVYKPGLKTSLQWRHNGRDSVSNHQPHDCLLNRLFRRRSKKTSNSASQAFVRVIPRGPGHKWPVMRKMFPFDDAFMVSVYVHSFTWGVIIYPCPTVNVVELNRPYAQCGFS